MVSFQEVVNPWVGVPYGSFSLPHQHLYSTTQKTRYATLRGGFLGENLSRHQPTPGQTPKQHAESLPYRRAMTAHLPTTTYGCSPASLGDGLYLGLNPTHAGKTLPSRPKPYSGRAQPHIRKEKTSWQGVTPARCPKCIRFPCVG